MKRITKEQEKQILGLISCGVIPSMAAKMADVTTQAVDARRRRDRRFRRQMLDALASGEMKMLLRVPPAASKSWIAAVSILERRWPRAPKQVG